MLNVIKMDLYRMFRSKITWIILIIVGIIAVTIMLSMHRNYEYHVNHPEELTISEQYTEEEAEEIRAEYAEDPIYSANSVFDVFYFYSDITQNMVMGLFIAVFTVVFAGAENNSGFIKNIASQPLIRYRTILSKSFLIFVFTGIVLILDFVISIICSQLLFGYICIGLYSISDMLSYTLTQLLLNCALGIVVLCVTELIRNQAISMAIGVFLSIGLARLITDCFTGTEHFSFSQLLITTYIPALTLPFSYRIYQPAWIVGIVLLVISVAISIFSMTKRDIK